MSVDKNKIEKCIKGILEAIGENPLREGLIETPERVAKMYEEVFEGIHYTNDDIANMFDKTFKDDLDIDEKNGDMIIMRNIEFFSFCEHHLALMYNMRAMVAYIPNEKVIGLSKIARIVDLVGKRLQLQERIGMDISEILRKIVDTENVAVIIAGEHACMTTRGIKKSGSKTITSCFKGIFQNNIELQNQLFILFKEENQ